MTQPARSRVACSLAAFALTSLLSGCGSGGSDAGSATSAQQLTLSGRVTASQSLGGTVHPGVYSMQSGNVLAGVLLNSDGSLTYRPAQYYAEDNTSVPAVSGRWRVINDVLIVQRADQSGQTECTLQSQSDTTGTLSCTTIGGGSDGTVSALLMTPVALRDVLTASGWQAGNDTARITVTLAANGSYNMTSYFNGEQEDDSGTWSLQGLRLALAGFSESVNCDFAGWFSPSEIIESCRVGTDPAHLTVWTPLTTG